MLAFFTLAQLLVVTLAGLAIAKSPLKVYTQPFIRWIPWVIYLLLFCVAYEISGHLAHMAWQIILFKGLILAFLLISANLLGSLIVFLPQRKQLTSKSQFQPSAQLQHIFRDLVYTVAAFVLGICAYWVADQFQFVLLLNSWSVLLFLMFLIGIDLAALKFTQFQFNFRLLIIPSIILISSSLVALVFPLLFNGLDYRQSIALAQGYGWYSMSAPIQKQLGSPELGTLALLIDLGREIFAIFFIQTLGRLFPNTAIGLGGATSMDATLGIIQQNCGQQFMIHAIFSGLILSCVGPILIVWLLSY